MVYPSDSRIGHSSFKLINCVNVLRVWEAVGTSAHPRKRSSGLMPWSPPMFPPNPVVPQPIHHAHVHTGRRARKRALFSALSIRKSPCLSSPCQNNGDCWVDSFLGFKYVCHPHFSGNLRSNPNHHSGFHFNRLLYFHQPIKSEHIFVILVLVHREAL